MTKCPCNTGKKYEECCLPYHQGDKNPLTAEETMRARYSAFAKGELDYIEKTHDPDDSENFDVDNIREWALGSKWHGLEIVQTEKGLEGDDEGIVEFKAHYESKGIKNTHHEVSEFQRKDGQWYFIDGQVITNQIVRSAPKVGRNDPCPCGSGKKNKKCCLNK
ncbi:MAG: YchJ family protein [Bacteriovoracaceae bacterium]|nr:YchJ family protein [Bacteriovoracaceae bacterium]